MIGANDPTAPLGETDAASIGALKPLASFLTDFARYAGRDAVYAGALLGVGAAVDSLGLALLIPVLGVMAPATSGSGGLRRLAAGLFGLVGAHSPLAQLAVLLALYAALMIVRAVVMIGRDVKLAKLQIGFLECQRGAVADLLAGARWERLARLRHARIANLMSSDLQRVSAGVGVLMQSAVSAAMLAAQCALLIVLAPALAAVALALLLALGLTLAPMMRRSRRLGRFVAAANLTLVDAAAQFLGGLKLAVSQNLQGGFTRAFRTTLAALSERQIAGVRERSQARLGVSLLSAAVGGTVVFVGFGLLHAPAAVLITVLLVIGRLSAPVGQIQQALHQIAFALPAYEQLAELKRDLAAVADAAPDTGPQPFPTGAVVFEGVSFQHADASAPGLRGVHDLDLILHPGDVLGVTGPSGAGKTTFADLLVGLTPPQAGRITVGGLPLEGATLRAWRDAIAYVSQDPFLFHDSVRRNLAWANPRASEADMWRALALAEAETLVRGLEGGLDGVVGERGTLVSGGERQRIALARAMLRRPQLLVLDEATNAIDLVTERAFLERLDALTPRPTIVVIAHRPESLALCNAILRLEAGTFVDNAARKTERSPAHRFSSQFNYSATSL